jgi:hypothetical protein
MEKMVRHITRSLFVPLLPEEKETEVKTMLDLIKFKQTAADKIAGYQEAIKLQKAEVEVCENSIKDSARKIEHGVLQDVPCKMILNWEEQHVTVFRKDTFEVVDDREMTNYDKPELTDEQYEPDAVKTEQ